ncbi:MAG: glycosyltransferase, partial [Prosthecobacter sp.]|nr:glycosyltransferase [Prosthecobacter sp.]
MLPQPSPDSPPAAGPAGLRVAGKFFRRGAEKVFLNGVSYGPFRSNERGEPFPEEVRLKADLAHIRALGFNLVRLYELPSTLFMAIAEELGLSLLVSIPWTDHVDFLQTHAQRRAIEQQVLRAVAQLKQHACIAGFLVGNEIEKTLVRWLGPLRVQRFLEHLIALGRKEAPEHLFSYATYPSTEYLAPRNADFLAVNLYLEQPEALTAYLQRLQNLAGNKPLLITEFGMDVARHGEMFQADAVRWEWRCLRQAGVAGRVWFSYTDEWYRGGKEVTEWRFGLVNAERQPRLACAVLEALPAALPDESASPRISVVVCTRNGSATLSACLSSLAQLRYPNHEIILIDDGSTHDIAAIALCFPQVRYLRQEHAGLSVARNLGASLASGEIIAYTDDDCLVDEDWLTYLATAFDDPQWVAAGGPNIPPPPRNRVEAI